jgi:hypothetical protein
MSSDESTFSIPADIKRSRVSLTYDHVIGAPLGILHLVKPGGWIPSGHGRYNAKLFRPSGDHFSVVGKRKLRSIFALFARGL